MATIQNKIHKDIVFSEKREKWARRDPIINNLKSFQDIRKFVDEYPDKYYDKKGRLIYD